MPVLARREVDDPAAERVEDSERSPDPLFLLPVDLAPGQLALQAPQPVHEEHPVQVVGLVAEGAGEKARPLDLPRPSRRRRRPAPARAPDARPSRRSPGSERQPSSSFCSPEDSTTTGLTRTITASGSAPTERSMIATRLLTPIWGAARPDAGRRVAGLDHVADEARQLLASRDRLLVLGEQPRVAVTARCRGSRPRPGGRPDRRGGRGPVLGAPRHVSSHDSWPPAPLRASTISPSFRAYSSAPGKPRTVARGSLSARGGRQR